MSDTIRAYNKGENTKRYRREYENIFITRKKTCKNCALSEDGEMADCPSCTYCKNFSQWESKL